MFKVTYLEFKGWNGRPLVDTYGGKAVINYKGNPLFVELTIVEMLREKGWKAVWIDNFKRKFRTSLQTISPLTKLPKDKLELLQTIAGSKSINGCWDVFAWKNDKVKFVECKRIGKDKIRESQIGWYRKAVKLGVPKTSFLIVEWELRYN
jgi:hypothetical protein